MKVAVWSVRPPLGALHTIFDARQIDPRALLKWTCNADGHFRENVDPAWYFALTAYACGLALLV
jgi:hypothetical protein